MSKNYKVKNSHTKKFGEPISIVEYFKNEKWTKLKKHVGRSSKHLNDEMLCEFISKHSPEEICLLILDKKGETHLVDFSIQDFLD